MIFINEFNKEFDPLKENYEPWEILLVKQNIQPDSVVLELGGRLGIVSCFINQKLQNKFAHVVIEPNSKYTPFIEKNKIKHHAKFQILNGVISDEFLKYDPIQESCDVCKEEDSNVETYTYDDALLLLGLSCPPFNTVVADCEGAFERFLRENIDRIKDWRYVHLEVDYSNKCDYNWIDQTFLQNGFSREDVSIQRIYKKIK